MRHEGRAIVVTGAAGAIGFATCEILMREGASLLLVDNDRDGLKARMAQLAGGSSGWHCAAGDRPRGRLRAGGRGRGLRQRRHGRLRPHRRVLQQRRHRGRPRAHARIRRRHVRQDHPGEPALDVPGPALRAAAHGPGRGAVVDTASIGSERGLAGACAYNAAKHGAVGLTHTAASKVAQRGVRVNCVMPGVIETPLLVGMLEQMFDGDVARAHGYAREGGDAQPRRPAARGGRCCQLPPQRQGELRQRRQVGNRRRGAGDDQERRLRQRVTRPSG